MHCIRVRRSGSWRGCRPGVAARPASRQRTIHQRRVEIIERASFATERVAMSLTVISPTFMPLRLTKMQLLDTWLRHDSLPRTQVSSCCHSSHCPTISAVAFSKNSSSITRPVRTGLRPTPITSSSSEVDGVRFAAQCGDMAGLQSLNSWTGAVLIERDVVEAVAQLLQQVGDRLQQALAVARFDLRLHAPDQLLDRGKGMLPGHAFLAFAQVGEQHHIANPRAEC